MCAQTDKVISRHEAAEVKRKEVIATEQDAIKPVIGRGIFWFSYEGKG